MMESTQFARAGGKRQQSGMTYLELIVTLLVIGIISAIVYPRISSSQSLTVAHQAEQVAAHIRHAQALAQNWGCDVKLTINATNYSLTSRIDYFGTDKYTLCGNSIATIQDPSNRAAFSYALLNSIQFTNTGNIYFDSMGRPVSAVGALLGTDTSFTLNGGANNWKITIIAISGYVTLVAI